MYQIGAICAAPSLLAAEEFLRGEGFTDVVDVATEGSTDVFKALSSGKADMALDFIGGHIIQVDKGAPIVVLGPGHIGCSELFGTDRVRAIRDLKGKTVALAELGPGSMQHLIVASMATYLGMDPRKDIKFVVHPDDMAIRPFLRHDESALETLLLQAAAHAVTSWSTPWWTGHGPNTTAA